MDYRVYAHVIGLPNYLDYIHEDLEEMFEENNYSADEAEKFIKKNVFNDRYGRKINVYIVKED